MTAEMFLLGDDGRLTGLTERQYDSEDRLQCCSVTTFKLFKPMTRDDPTVVEGR